jgi:hypothetical protein
MMHFTLGTVKDRPVQVSARAGCGVLSLRTTSDSTIRYHVIGGALFCGLTVSFGMRSDRLPEKRCWQFLIVLRTAETSPSRHPSAVTFFTAASPRVGEGFIPSRTPDEQLSRS